MTDRTPAMTVSIVAGLLALGACTEAQRPVASRPSVLVDKTWLATDVAGADVQPGSHVTLRFAAAGTVSGSAGCNRYSAPYRLDRNRLQITGPIVSTRMACAPPVMAQEARFLDALPKATLATESRPGVLNLSAGDTLLARFVATD